MGVPHAVEAYRHSAYQNIEYNIDASIRRSGSLLFGGLGSRLKSVGNTLVRPLKVGKALAIGGDYSAQAVKQAEVPEDIKDTQYIQALDKLRQSGREAADMRAESVGKLLSGDLGGFLRKRRAASYNDVQMRKIILPDETVDSGANVVNGIVSGVMGMGAKMAMLSLVKSGAGSSGFGDLGNLSHSLPVLPVAGNGGISVS